MIAHVCFQGIESKFTMHLSWNCSCTNTLCARIVLSLLSAAVLAVNHQTPLQLLGLLRLREARAQQALHDHDHYQNHLLLTLTLNRSLPLMAALVAWTSSLLCGSSKRHGNVLIVPKCVIARMCLCYSIVYIFMDAIYMSYY